MKLEKDFQEREKSFKNQVNILKNKLSDHETLQTSQFDVICEKSVDLVRKEKIKNKELLEENQMVKRDLLEKCNEYEIRIKALEDDCS